MGAAEDESDIQAAKVARAEQKAELAEFDESIPWDEREVNAKREREEQSKVEMELALLEKEVSCPLTSIMSNSHNLMIPSLPVLVKGYTYANCRLNHFRFGFISTDHLYCRQVCRNKTKMIQTRVPLVL